MNLFKRITAAALSAVMIASTGLSAFAESDGVSAIKSGDGSSIIVVDFSDEASVIDPGAGTGDSGSTSVIEPSGESTETTVIDADDDTISGRADSVLDVSNHIYSPIDITGWTEWDGKTKLQKDTNYYITGEVKPRMNFSVPAGSRLLIKRRETHRIQGQVAERKGRAHRGAGRGADELRHDDRLRQGGL